jgi:hypothetical protein
MYGENKMGENIHLLEELSEFQNSQMSRRRLLQLLGYGIGGIAGIDILASCGGPTPPPPNTITPQVITNLEGTRQLTPYFSGYNNVPIHSPSWQVPDVVNAAKQLKPGTLRYPGGTVANYWDWQKGWFLSNAPSGLQSASFSIYRPQELQIAIQATGAIPIYVLNMLTSDLNNQLEMLRTAKNMGLPVQFIEMGNEFYLKTSDNVQKFPTGQDYGTMATSWIKAIRAEFPDVKIAVSGSLHTQTHEPRQANWNKDLLQNLQGADAIALHPYVPIRNGMITQDASVDNAMKILGLVLTAWKGFDDAIKSLPQGMEVWFTEYNVNDMIGTFHRTWIQGITTTVMTLAYLEDNRVSLVCLYDMIGKTGFESFFYDSKGQGASGTSLAQYSLTADGWSMRLLNDTMRGMTSAQKMSFNPNPLIDGSGFSYPSLQGWVFSNGTTPQTFIINRSADNFLWKEESAFPQGSRFQQLMSDPFKLITGPGSLTVKSGALQDQLVLPAYSLTQLKQVHT